MAIYDDNIITINLNELVAIRAKLLTQREDYSEKIVKGEYLDENDVDNLASKLRATLTWDTLYYMIDESILDYLDINEKHYGEIAGDEPAATFEKERKEREKNAKKFKLVKLSSSSWEIDVPIRIKD